MIDTALKWAIGSVTIGCAVLLIAWGAKDLGGGLGFMPHGYVLAGGFILVVAAMVLAETITTRKDFTPTPLKEGWHELMPNRPIAGDILPLKIAAILWLALGVVPVVHYVLFVRPHTLAGSITAIAVILAEAGLIVWWMTSALDVRRFGEPRFFVDQPTLASGRPFMLRFELPFRRDVRMRSLAIELRGEQRLHGKYTKVVNLFEDARTLATDFTGGANAPMQAELVFDLPTDARASSADQQAPIAIVWYIQMIATPQTGERVRAFVPITVKAA